MVGKPYLCPTCRDAGEIWSGPYRGLYGLRAGKMIPCPDCADKTLQAPDAATDSPRRALGGEP